ncbi:MAG: hypothetical protein DSO01_05965 [Archaeoglobi archaeon]|nr:MAG: hypothetical protein DSO01_05965 [Archaeoglobi archaeon]
MIKMMTHKPKVLELLEYMSSITGFQHSMDICLIDTGYLSYFSAVFPGKLLELRSRFYQGLWLLESSSSVRKEVFPQYKSHRRENSLTQLAHENRVRIAEDTNLIRISAQGYEADDLVALLLILFSRYSSIFKSPRNLRIIGGDKDYAQLEHLIRPFGLLRILGFYSGNQESIMPSQTLLRKLPKWVTRCFPKTPSPLDYAIVQALLGDSSDDVPRVLYAKDSELLAASFRIPLNQQHPMDRFEYLHKVLDEKRYLAFLQHLQLVLFPHYSLWYPGEFEELLPNLWRYHQPEEFLDELIDAQALERLDQKLRIEYPFVGFDSW